MALPSSGSSISLSQVNVELGRSSTATISMGESAVRTLFGVASGQITMSNGFGKSNTSVVTGGTLFSDATYYYRRFTASDSLTVSGANLPADAIVVAGGGGGAGAGGGAGGFVAITSATLPAATYTITVGGGGVNTGGSDSSIVNSSTSAVVGSVAKGGNYSYNWMNTPPNDDAGSGMGGGRFGNLRVGYSSYVGGALPFAYFGETGTAGQGNNGGNLFHTGSNFAGGGNPRGASAGGGGAGGVGSNATVNGSTYVAGNGGIGTNTYSTWATVTSSGQSGRYAGGGGGASSGTSKGTGGTGGGGAGANLAQPNGTNGLANTGGGGGSSHGYTTGTNGGSGIVIVRYLRSAVGG